MSDGVSKRFACDNSAEGGKEGVVVLLIIFLNIIFYNFYICLIFL